MLSARIATIRNKRIGTEVPPAKSLPSRLPPPVPDGAARRRFTRRARIDGARTAAVGAEKTAIGASDRGFACYLSGAQPGAARRGIARTPHPCKE